jgi:4-amino-4-deoxy-L-arabinose transferase-like glycosyltransferase
MIPHLANRRSPARVLLLAALPLVLAAALAARSAFRESCTVDEFGNLPLTVAYWRGGALHVDPGNPPLTRWIQGIPLLPSRAELGCTRAELDSIRTSWDLGYRFEATHGSDYHALLVKARLGSVALLLATVAGVTVLAAELAGPAAALASGLLAAACPNLLAHGRLVTPDVGLACFTVWSLWAARRARRRRDRRSAALAGLLVSCAVLSKFSGLVLFPLVGLALAGVRPAATAAGASRPAGVAARLGVFAAAVLAPIWIAYGLASPGVFRGWPTPFPAPFVAGIVAQLAEPPYPAYLFGELREGGGWSHYHLVAFLVKTPLPVLALFIAAIALVARERRSEFGLPLVAVLVFFLVFGAATRKNIGVRYVLPVLPLLHVVAGAVLCGPRATRRPPAVAAAAWILLALSTAQGVAASAAPLAAFNGLEALWGGKRAVLVDSNLDWGQALPDLRAWQEREGIETVQLAYFGRIDPSLYGIRWRTLPSKPVRGPAAISATLAVGRPYAVLMKERPFLEPERAWSTPDTWTWIRDLPPDEELGSGAILVWKDVGAAWDAHQEREGGGGG